MFILHIAFSQGPRVRISNRSLCTNVRGLLFSDNLVFFTWGEYLHCNSNGLRVVDASFYSLLLPLHLIAVFRHPSCSDHLDPLLCLSGGQAGRLCGSELPTQSGWWMELQYLFRRLFLKLWFHSTVPVSRLPPPAVSWATPPGQWLACWIHFCFNFPMASWNWWLATSSTEAGSEHGSSLSV